MTEDKTEFTRRQLLFGGLGLAATATLAACSTGTPTTVTVTKTLPPTSGVSVTPTRQTSAHGAATATSTATSDPASPATPVRVTMIPADGSGGVAPAQPITITVFNADINEITVTAADRSTIAGTITDDRRSWTATERPKYGTKYTVNGTAAAADGTSVPITGTFTTAAPKDTMRAAVQIPNGHTVGIAAPIVITFAGQVANRAAAEQNLHVATTDATGKPFDIEGSWGWMQDEDIQGNGTKQSRVHFRPKDFWPGGTNVHLEANLYGVDYGGDAWGRENVTRDFAIGPNLLVKADVNSHRLLVVQDDTVIKNFPVSYGVPATIDDGRTTVSGVHVITEKFDLKELNNPKYGYYGFKAFWAVRMNNNGEFIHANQEVADQGLLGKKNVSHGCVNMSLKDAETFYNMVYYGVPVDVEDTNVPMTQADYIWDWSVPYSQWKTFSAL